jgi:hypothetical protein
LWERPSYLRDATKVLSEAERENIVSMLAADPTCGDLIKQAAVSARCASVSRGVGSAAAAE